MSTARTYKEDKNPDGGAIPGVPLRDITVDEWNSFPNWVQRSIDAAPFYQRVKGSPEAAQEPKQEDAPAPAVVAQPEAKKPTE